MLISVNSNIVFVAGSAASPTGDVTRLGWWSGLKKNNSVGFLWQQPAVGQDHQVAALLPGLCVCGCLGSTLLQLQVCILDYSAGGDAHTNWLVVKAKKNKTNCRYIALIRFARRFLFYIIYQGEGNVTMLCKRKHGSIKFFFFFAILLCLYNAFIAFNTFSYTVQGSSNHH